MKRWFAALLLLLSLCFAAPPAFAAGSTAARQVAAAAVPGQKAAPVLKSVANTATGVKVTWGKVAGAAKYRVFYKAGSGKWTKAGDSASASYTWTKAKSGTKYAFTVRCLSADGKKYTSGYNKTGKSITYIAAPKITKLSASVTSVKVTWGKVKGAAKYRVFYKTGSGSWKKAGDSASTSFTWKKAKANTKYTFTVRCLSKDNKSYTSAFDTAGKAVSTPLPTPKLTGVKNTAKGVQISWGKVAGAAQYRIFYLKGGKWTKLADTTKTSYTWTKAKSGTKYTFTVRCLSKDSKKYTSAYDTAGKAVTHIAAPAITKLQSTAKGVKVTWGKVGGAAKYRVFYKNSSGGWTKAGDTTATSFTWTGAKDGKKYTFTVRCLAKDGKSYTSAYDTAGKAITFKIPEPDYNAPVTAANTMAMLDYFDPDGAYIIRNTSEAGMMQWMSGANRVTDELSTAVHEQCHEYTIRGWSSDRYYIGNGKSVVVNYTDVYDSAEMAKAIPQSLQTFRYGTYVSPYAETNMASRQLGVYGLMNEFTAYCWGFNDSLKTMDYCHKNGDYSMSNDGLAHGEFLYYIVNYMAYAKEHYPSVYNGIMANKNFLKAFKAVNTKFTASVNTLFKRYGNVWWRQDYDKLMNELNKAPYKAILNKMMA